LFGGVESKAKNLKVAHEYAEHREHGEYIDYLTMKMTSNGKILNYKVVDLVESYNFHIRFTSIRVDAKKLQFFLNII
jgi:hypothetical protein